MKVTFLGTGTSQGVPVIACTCPVCLSLDYRDKRLRTSIHLEVDDLSLVIDTGPDFRQQMLRESVKRVDAILFTHAHRDHTAGLDDVRAYNFLQNTDMPIYGEPFVMHQIRTDFSYIFGPETYPGLPRIQTYALNHEPFTIGTTTITPLPVLHLKLPVLGFRIHNFSYITDANFIPDDTYERLKGTEVLVINALQREKHISHFNLEEALAVAKKVNAPRTYFTHISHKLGLHAAVDKELPATVLLAHDGLTLHL